MLPEHRRQSVGSRAGEEVQPLVRTIAQSREKRNSPVSPLLLASLLPVPATAQTQPEASFPATKPGEMLLTLAFLQSYLHLVIHSTVKEEQGLDLRQKQTTNKQKTAHMGLSVGFM